MTRTDMRLIDMHCDTIWKILDLQGTGDFAENDCSVSLSKLRKAGSLAQFFACFLALEEMKGNTTWEKYEAGYRHVLEMIRFFHVQMEKHSKKIAPAASGAEVNANSKAGRISAILTVEEGGVLNGEIRRLQELYDKGIRLITLLWNYENCIGYPNSCDNSEMQKGLKPFGIEVVEHMEQLGMIIDVSHASDGTFRDVLLHSKGPVVASHSNCRALCAHPRNLTDEMIRALAERGGVAGLNFYSAFLDGSRESRMEAMIAQLKHMVKIGGSDFPAIGTDFDGFDGVDYLDVPDIGEMGRLEDALKKDGFTSSQIDKIWCKNALRVIREVIR